MILALMQAETDTILFYLPQCKNIRLTFKTMKERLFLKNIARSFLNLYVDTRFV